jgi:hypothetical protein
LTPVTSLTRGSCHMSRMILIFALIFSALAAASDSAHQAAYRADTLTPINITPTFDNGYLVVYNHEDVALYAPDGTLSYRIKVPETALIPNVAVHADGTAAAAINSQIHGGAILVFDNQGSRILKIDTGNFLPSFICFAADHSIWTTGRQGRRGETAQFFILRHYSQNGTELGGFLPRSSFQDDGEPATDIVGLSGLRTASDRVGALLTFGGIRTKSLWVETDMAGNEIGRWPMNIDGFPAALTASGAVYGQTGDGFLFTLNRSTGTWNRITPESDARLLGGNDEALVMMLRGRAVVRWVPVSTLVTRR